MPISEADLALLPWLAENQAKLNLKYNLLTPSLLPTHVLVTIAGEYRNWSVNGHALRKDPLEARLVALTEFLERAAMSVYGKSSNGFAAHPEIELACRNARNELLERDAFFWHWDENAAPALLKRTGDTSFYQLSSLDPMVHVVMSVHEAAASGGIIVGLGSSQTLEGAIDGALREVAMIQISSEEVYAIRLDQFLKIEKPAPRDHIRLAHNPEYAVNVRRWLEGPGKIREPKNFAVHIQELAWPEDLFSPPMRLIQAASPDLINLRFGVFGKNPLPHPFG